MTQAASLPDSGALPGGGLMCVVERTGTHAEVRLLGTLEIDTVWTLGAELSQLIRSGYTHLVLDLAGCTSVSPVCVGVLNRAVLELRNGYGGLVLRNVAPAVVNRLRGAGLHPAVLTPGRHLDAI